MGRRSDCADAFRAAFAAGRICLHPTDTLPGLTFDPQSAAARDALAVLKGRDVARPCLALVASLASARRFFAPLPGGWEATLGRLWPGPLSVVWRAAPAAPASLVAADGTIGLRVPALSSAAGWFAAVLATAEVPLPTTSVNRSGEPPAVDFAGARARFGEPAVYCPVWTASPAREARPSTVIRLAADGGYTVLRAGALSLQALERWAPGAVEARRTTGCGATPGSPEDSRRGAAL